MVVLQQEFKYAGMPHGEVTFYGSVPLDIFIYLTRVHGIIVCMHGIVSAKRDLTHVFSRFQFFYILEV